MKPIGVLIVDDHTLIRKGIRALLQDVAGIQVVAEAGDGREAMGLVETHRPDVVLMDITMPGMNGLEATARIAKAFPESRVLILTIHTSEEYVLKALQAGAAGYLLKDAMPDELKDAVQMVARGESYLSPSVSKYVVNYLQRPCDREDPNPFERLTPRQREILQLIAEGLTTREIAQRLHVSQNTVETHRAQMMERLGIHDLAGLVRYAVRKGIVSLEE